MFLGPGNPGLLPHNISISFTINAWINVFGSVVQTGMAEVLRLSNASLGPRQSRGEPAMDGSATGARGHGA